MMAQPDAAFLDIAAVLGRRISRDALWAGERCNWLGDSMEFVDNAWIVVHRALGPDFYGGTSGIALFLARLYRLTGERLFRITAEGAIAHALSRPQDFPPAGRLAFHAGWTGIAYALAELGEAFGNGEFIERAFALIGDAASHGTDDLGLDVISGSAGAIPPLIDLHRRHPGADVLPLAVMLGEQLLARAHRDDAGWSWNTLEGHAGRDLTGFSHGVSGIAWALLELYAETDEAKFREGAERGFANERQWFNPEQENWPDFRGTMAAPGSSGPGYTAAWCHGAPGIGLARVRGYEILREVELRREAEAAIRTTTRILNYQAYAVQTDFALCHGCGGNAELLIYAGEALGDNAARATAEAIGRRGIEAFGRHDLPWPCGVPSGGETPNLMLGLAGIGYFYLRLYDPKEIPSVLIIRPASAA
jgi:lantibiotic modifying enzyme